MLKLTPNTSILVGFQQLFDVGLNFFDVFIIKRPEIVVKAGLSVRQLHIDSFVYAIASFGESCVRSRTGALGKM